MNAKRDWHDKEFTKLVTLGESTTAGGWSSCRERCWAQQLARTINEYQRTPVQLVNSGIGANVISTKSRGYDYSGKPAATERLDKHVIAHKPDLLVIAYGLNDARCGTPLDLFCDEMRAIIDRVRAAIKPLIVLPSPFYMTDFGESGGGPPWAHGSLEIFHQYAAAIEQVASERDCLYADLLESYHQADWMVHFDGCHANDLGHRIVANKIFEVLASNCSGLALETKTLEKQIPRWRDESMLMRDYDH
jgi:lysophospholipase L1-like esterase